MRRRPMRQLSIPTEPIGSIPRPASLLSAINSYGEGVLNAPLEELFDAAVRDTILEFEATGSPVITDGEQRKFHNFWTYSVHGLPNTCPDGAIPLKIRERVQGTAPAALELGFFCEA